MISTIGSAEVPEGRSRDICRGHRGEKRNRCGLCWGRSILRTRSSRARIPLARGCEYSGRVSRISERKISVGHHVVRSGRIQTAVRFLGVDSDYVMPLRAIRIAADREEFEIEAKLPAIITETLKGLVPNPLNFPLDVSSRIKKFNRYFVADCGPAKSSDVDRHVDHDRLALDRHRCDGLGRLTGQRCCKKRDNRAQAPPHRVAAELTHCFAPGYCGFTSNTSPSGAGKGSLLPSTSTM
jgi:hypothetical protein